MNCSFLTGHKVLVTFRAISHLVCLAYNISVVKFVWSYIRNLCLWRNCTRGPVLRKQTQLVWKLQAVSIYQNRSVGIHFGILWSEPLEMNDYSNFMLYQTASVVGPVSQSCCCHTKELYCYKPLCTSAGFVFSQMLS